MRNLTLKCLLLFFFSMMILRSGAQVEDKRFCQSQDKNRFNNIEQQIKTNRHLVEEWKKKATLTNRFEGLIPLVFHIVLEEGRDTIPNEQILQQIEVLNESFGRQNDDLAKIDEQFRDALDYQGPLFCLAYKSVGGKKQAAIEYKTVDSEFFGDQTNSAGYPSIKYEQLGGFDAWNSDHYLNIWIAELEFAQGKSTLPNTVPDPERGIIIDPDYFGVHERISPFYPFHLGKTLVHEMGHFFGLLHPWGLSESCTEDDGIEDTPLQEYIYTGCPTLTPSSCGSPDMYMNFMNFTDDECLVHFTTQQMESVWATLGVFYPDLYRQIDCYKSFDEDSVLDQLAILYFNTIRKIKLESPGISPQEINLFLYQIDGKLLRSKSLLLERYEEIDLNGLPTGIYILFLRSEGNFRAMKLLVY